MRLQGKTALVTGATRRIGREIALSLAGEGASVILHYRRSKPDAVKLQREIEDFGGQAWPIHADFSFKKGNSIDSRVKAFLRSVSRQTRQVDILVNNAAIFYPTPFGKISEKDWDDFLTVNLKVPFFLAQALGQKMKKRKFGKIIRGEVGVKTTKDAMYGGGVFGQG